MAGEIGAGSLLGLEFGAEPLGCASRGGFAGREVSSGGPGAAADGPLSERGGGGFAVLEGRAGRSGLQPGQSPQVRVQVVGLRLHGADQPGAVRGQDGPEEPLLEHGGRRCEHRAEQVGHGRHEAGRIGDYLIEVDNGRPVPVPVHKLEDPPVVGHPDVDRVSRVDDKRRVAAAEQRVDHVLGRPHHEQPAGLGEEFGPEVEH